MGLAELLRRDACMLDIQGKLCNHETIKSALIPLLGKNVKIKYNLGRNKYSVFDAKIIRIYNALFIVETEGGIKSFSFADIITKIIKIYC